MTYGRARLRSLTRKTCEGAAVSHSAELVRGKLVAREGPLIRPFGAPSPQGEKVFGGLRQESTHDATPLMTPAMMRAVSSQRGSFWPAVHDASAMRARRAGIGEQALDRGGERAYFAGRHLERRGFGHRLGRGAAGGGDDRQPPRHRFGQRHAVALVERWHQEDVGASVVPVELAGVQRPDQIDAIAEAGVANGSLEAGQGLRAAVGGPGDGQPPVVGLERAQRAHQDVVGLARHHGADGQELDRRACAACAGRRLGARLGDGDRRFRHAEVGDQGARRGSAGGDDAARQRQCRRLGRAQRALPRLGRGRLPGTAGGARARRPARQSGERSPPAWHRRRGRR